MQSMNEVQVVKKEQTDADGSRLTGSPDTLSDALHAVNGWLTKKKVMSGNMTEDFCPWDEFEFERVSALAEAMAGKLYIFLLLHILKIGAFVLYENAHVHIEIYIYIYIFFLMLEMC